MTEQATQEVQKGQSKVERRFIANFSKVIALFNGDETLFKESKVPNTEVAGIVNELLKEQKEEAVTNFKREIKTLLSKKLLFDKEIKKAEEELKKTKEAKMAEFSQTMENLFKKVEDINEIETSFTKTLKDLETK